MQSFAQYFDKKVCLTLDARLLANLPDNGIHPLQGVVGGDLEMFVVGKGQLLPPEKYNLVDRGAIPITWQGHPNSYYAFRAFQHIVQQANAEGRKNLLLLEDDAAFIENWKIVWENVQSQLQQIASTQHDAREFIWDMLYLGANHTWACTREVAPNLLHVNGSVCWHAVAIHAGLFDEILDWPPQHPIDLMAAKRLHAHHKCYAVWPSIAIQEPGFSYVEGRKRNYGQYWSCKGNVWEG